MFNKSETNKKTKIILKMYDGPATYVFTFYVSTHFYATVVGFYQLYISSFTFLPIPAGAVSADSIDL